MLNYKEAQQIIAANARSFGTETISLDDALGRVLVERISADRDYPPFNRATMDGYAIRFANWQEGTKTYTVKEVIFAGSVYQEEIAVGECYKIMTGASVPPVADLIIRREDAAEENGRVTFTVEQVKSGQNIAKKGEDIKADADVISQNMVCTPAVIALLASFGKTSFVVAKRPTVALFTTGDELVAPSEQVTAVTIRNSNQFLLKNLLKEWGINTKTCTHIPDDKALLKQHISAALDHDIIILCGGVSAGDADYVPEILEAAGVKKRFHKVSIRPGKPIWCGQMQSGGLVFALPGNPFSCHVTFKLFVEHYLISCFGLKEKPAMMLPLSVEKKKRVPLDEFFPVIVNQEVAPINFKTSGDIGAALMANAIGHHPADAGDFYTGDLLAFRML